MVRKVLANPTSPVSVVDARQDSAERGQAGVDVAALRSGTPTDHALDGEVISRAGEAPVQLTREHGASTPRGESSLAREKDASSTTPLPAVYRGKASGEFQRVAAPPAADTNGLIAEAERQLLSLPASDRNRRLLEVAILRRDPALLRGILQSLRGLP
jgi:hypothetical protein